MVINKHLIDEFLSLEDNTNLGLKPPKKLVRNILNLIGNRPEKEEKDNWYHSTPPQIYKRVKYSDLREKKKNNVIIKNVKEYTIEDSVVKEFQK